MQIRPMRPEDLVSAEQVTARAFGITRDDHITGPAGEEHLGHTSGLAGEEHLGHFSGLAGEEHLGRDRWLRRAAHIHAHDPGGCWIADAGDEVAGVAMATRRDLLWNLSTFAVLPGHQGRGVGAALLDAAVEHGAGCLRGLILALPDPAALRRYRRAGFTLHPTMRLDGVVERRALPVVDGIREGFAADRDLADSVDRQVRGAAHGPDHDALREESTLLVCDLFTGHGYAYVGEASVSLLAATNRSVAQRLLWAALARIEPGTSVAVRYLSADQDWAIDVGLAAGLRIGRDGFLALRHMRPPAPYVPSVPFG